MKRKKGNTLLLLLVIGMIIAVLGTTLAGAVSYTTKNNIRDKDIEDLIYAAESGVEYVFTKYKNGELSPSSPHTVKSSTPTLVGDLGLDNYINLNQKIKYIEVNCTAKDVTGSILVTSKSIDSNLKQKTVTTKLKVLKGLGGDIFNNSLVAGKDEIQVVVDGACDLGTTNISAPGDKDIHGAGNGSSITSPVEKNDGYEDLRFINEFKKVNKLEFNGVGELTSKAVNLTPYVASGAIIPEINTGIGYLEYPTFGSPGYKIYLINADEIDIYVGASENLFSTIIICSGKINIKPQPVNARYALHCTYSTIFGTNIQFDQNGSVTMHYMPVPNVGTATNAYYLEPSELDVVNPDIRKFISNWGLGSGGGSGGGSFSIVQDEYAID